MSSKEMGRGQLIRSRETDSFVGGGRPLLFLGLGGRNFPLERKKKKGEESTGGRSGSNLSKHNSPWIHQGKGGKAPLERGGGRGGLYEGYRNP